MLFYTHVAFSILLGLFSYEFLNNQILFFACLILFSLLPDIDESGSFISKRIFMLPKILNFIFSHRKFFHSLLFLVLVYIFLNFFNQTVALSSLIGISSHLILDAMTKEGIYPLYPLKLKTRGPIKTGKVFELIIFLIILAIIFIKLYTGHPQI